MLMHCDFFFVFSFTWKIMANFRIAREIRSIRLIGPSAGESDDNDGDDDDAEIAKRPKLA